MKKLSVLDTCTYTGKSSQFSSECWFDDACILDMDYFVKTLSGIKAKGVRPELIGSIIAHYASKWLPDLSAEDYENGLSNFEGSSESITASWMKKRFFLETLVGILPPERDSIPCSFLLRLLRIGNMVGMEPTYRAELENRIAWQLDQASLKDLMIPSFSHTCRTLFDIELILRLVKKFVSMGDAVKSSAATGKVAKLVDNYLAEAAIDANMSLSEFVALATVLPSHARAFDDGLYRALDTYLKAHPGVSKQERKKLCRVINCRKLSAEASLHASQNERLPVRAVIQVLFTEQTKLNQQVDWSGSLTAFTGLHSPNGFELPSRCLSKREVASQQMEIKRLREDVVRLQNQCNLMQGNIEKVLEKKKWFSKWKKLGLPLWKNTNGTESDCKVEEGEFGFGRQTPLDILMTTNKTKSPPPRKWRRSVS